jgi:TRAP-type C4-dicarboxylate transport system substrate-binding protein
MMSNKPLKTSADLQGQKIWIPEGDSVGFAVLQALGIAPVVMPVTDVMTGLQTDLLDSVAVPPVGAVVLQWHTRLDYITDMPLAYVYAALLIDRRAFGRMQEADQAVVREVMEGIYRKFDRYGVADNDEAMQALLDIGLEKVRPESGQISEWRSIANRTLDELAAGGEFDQELLARMRQLLKDYRESGGSSSAAP